VKDFKHVMSEVINQAKIVANSDGHTVGVSTGLIDVDKHLGGLHKSDLLILAGRPSMGKTALATNIAFYASKHRPIAFFSLEMSAEQLAMRILAQESGISSDRIRRGAIGHADMNSLQNTAKQLANLPFFIDDTPSLTIAGLRTRARRLVRQEKIALIVIDYLQLINGGGNPEGRVQELSFITRSLKSLAKELNIPVLALSQLSRAVEQREDKRPQLSDLRESGTIEQDADVVMFVFREAYYEARKKPPDGSAKMGSWQENMSKIHDLAELVIAKQRHGPIKTILLHYQDSLTKFGNYLGTGFED
jgi:replicative DNA helicase